MVDSDSDIEAGKPHTVQGKIEQRKEAFKHILKDAASKTHETIRIEERGNKLCYHDPNDDFHHSGNAPSVVKRRRINSALSIHDRNKTELPSLQLNNDSSLLLSPSSPSCALNR